MCLLLQRILARDECPNDIFLFLWKIMIVFQSFVLDYRKAPVCTKCSCQGAHTSFLPPYLVRFWTLDWKLELFYNHHILPDHPRLYATSAGDLESGISPECAVSSVTCIVAVTNSQVGGHHRWACFILPIVVNRIHATRYLPPRHRK